MQKQLLASTAILASFIFGATPNPKLTSIPDNTWRLIDTVGIQFYGHAAYSGGAYDRTHHQFLIFGGGHGDGFNNDVLALDISSMTWKSMYPTDPAGAYTCGNVSSSTPGMLLSSGLPASRHTYDQIDFIDHLGKMIIWSGPTYSALWSCPGQLMPADTWLYSWATNQWEYKNTSRQAQPSGESGCGGYDPVGKLYYTLHNIGGCWGQLFSYDADLDKWTSLSPSGPEFVLCGRMMTVDRKRQRLWLYPLYYDIKLNTVVQVSASGAPSAGLAESYDEANDVLVFYKDQQIYAYHTDQNQWELLSPANAPDPGHGPYGRFFYDPVDNVFLLIKWNGCCAQTWAYCYKRTPTPAEAMPARLAPAITLSPNPAGSTVTVNLPSGANNLGLYDIRGKMTGKTGRTFDVSDLAEGLYIVKVKTNGATHSARLMVER